MRRLFVILAVLLPFAVNAQKKGFKVVETVPTSQPKWVSAKESPDFIYVMGQEGATLSEAKNAALQCVLSDIAMSIAVNVKGEITDSSIFNVSDDNVKFEQTVVDNIKTKIAKIPAIQGITLQKADLFYKRCYNKRSGEEYYIIYVRYPFNEFERRDLIDEYNRMEKAIDNKIKTYMDSVGDVYSLEDIKFAISRLNDLKKELGEDDRRINDINAVIGMYSDIYNSIMIDVVENVPGRIMLRLIYVNVNRTMATTQKPKVSSECATDFDINCIDGVFVVRYDSRYCYQQDLPTVDVNFKVGSKNLSKQIRIQF